MNTDLGFWINPQGVRFDVYNHPDIKLRMHSTWAADHLKIEDGDKATKKLLKADWIRITSTDTFNVWKLKELNKIIIGQFIRDHKLRYESFDTVFIIESKTETEKMMFISEF